MLDHQGDYPAGKVFVSILCLAFVCAVLGWWLVPATASAAIQPGDLSDATFVEIRTSSGSVVMSGELQELEVDVISLEPRTTYHVFVNDRPAATFTTDDRGSVDEEFVFTPPVSS